MVLLYLCSCVRLVSGLLLACATWLVVARDGELCAASIAYLGVMVTTLCVNKMDSLWRPLGLLACGFISARYVFLFPYLASLSTPLTAWIGLRVVTDQFVYFALVSRTLHPTPYSDYSHYAPASSPRAFLTFARSPTPAGRGRMCPPLCDAPGPVPATHIHGPARAASCGVCMRAVWEPLGAHRCGPIAPQNPDEVIDQRRQGSPSTFPGPLLRQISEEVSTKLSGVRQKLSSE